MTEQTTDSFEVSPQQEQLWISQPEGPTGRMQATFLLEGAVEVGAVRSALGRLVARHEILRTTFVHRPGIRVPLQTIAGELSPIWASDDITALTPSEAEVRLRELAAEELSAPLDYTTGSLVLARLVRLAPERHALLTTFSALCMDASSLPVLGAELLSQITNQGELVEEPLQYADFAAWQRELRDAQDDEATQAREFWQEHGTLSSPRLPFTGAAEDVARRVEIHVGDELQGALAELAGRYGVSLASVAHGAWQVVLGASCGASEVASALISSERRHGDLDGALGAFAAPVPIVSRVAPDVTLAELLTDVDHAAAQATVWQDYAPERPDAIEIGVLRAAALDAQGGGLRIRLDDVRASAPGLKLWLTVLTGEWTVKLSLDYLEGYLEAAQAKRLAARVHQLLASAAEVGAAALGDLELVDDEERRQLLVGFNDSGPAVLSPSLPARFAAHAASAPARTAVIDAQGSITYEELNRRADQLARRLRRAGVAADTPVGLCTDRSIDMVVGLLGILKAGGAYLPLHYEHPRARMEHQLRTAGARVLVTQEALLSQLPALDGETICLDLHRAELDREDAGALDVEILPEHRAYVIYTSGSTGTPKGVSVTHGNVANYVDFIAGRVGARERPLSFGLVTSISTDLGNTSVFGALGSGGTLVLISPTAAADAGAFAQTLEHSPVDVLKITPSHIGALTAGGDARVLPREWLVIGGERAPWDLVERVRGLAQCGILNHYGPTEATIGCCTFVVGEGPGAFAPATVPLGSPIAGDSCYVLDERRRPAPLGAPGRLYVGGAGVADGYVGAPELTAERFLDDPFATGSDARMYDTGDQARWLPDGTLEFLGRVDEQVKIRGYRVEPAEVESALRAHGSIREAVVVARSGPAGDARLVAYCAALELDEAEVRAHLAEWLPDFMIPATIVTLDDLPRTPSGKIDRLSLPEPDEGAETGEYIAPGTPVEHALAEIWSHVLGVERVGIEEDFFALGGHSLLATQVVAQVRSDFAVDLPLHSLFTYPTIAALAEELVRLMGSSEEEETARLMAELEGLSDEDAERLLAGDSQPPEA